MTLKRTAVDIDSLTRTGTLLAEYMPPAQVAAELETCERTLARWHASRRGPPRILIGKRVMYRRAAVEEWLRKQEKGFDEVKTLTPPGGRREGRR
jgi:hypothetical protein